MPSHRAERHPAVGGPPGETRSGSPRPGRHARRPEPRHRPPRSRLAAGPTLVGVVALGAAAVGSLGTDASLASAPTRPEATVVTSTWKHVLGSSGQTDSVTTSALRDRERAVSRDSQREALADASQDDLQQAAEEQAVQRNAALAQLAASAEKQAGKMSLDAWQLPVSPGAYHLTAGFGQCSGLWSHCHTGLDFAAPTGTPIHAVAGGTISETGSAGAYGNRTIETLPDGTELWYCHQSAFGVKPGQKVVAGQTIGAVGSTGNTTGPHVHLEVRPGAGDPVDPKQALIAHGLQP